MKILLIGYMGSGKSSVGKILSELLKVPFKDLDTEIQNNEGMDIPSIFAEKGEIYFRKQENKVLKKILSQEADFVLATGGGTPCYADSMAVMLNAENTRTVFLKTPLPILCDRLLNEKGSRPILAHLDSREAMEEFVGIHLFERSHFYNQAELIIDTQADSPKEIAEKIMNNLF